MAGRFQLPAMVLVMLISGAGFGQTRILYGRVSGEGQPIPGVNVMVKQTTTGTVTDKDGKFSLEVPEDEVITLVLSFMGPYLERQVRRHENDLTIRINSGLSKHAVYLLAGPALSKVSSGSDVRHGFVLSVGYRYLYYRFGLGAELSLQQGPVDSEHGTLVQVGMPVIGYCRMGANFTALIGGGFYRSTYRIIQNDFKILGGVQHERRYWAFGLRYLNGTRKMLEGRDGVVQSLQVAVQYRVK